jgi:hypothetical protein
MPNVPLYAIKADYDQWNVVSSNGSAITATAKDNNKTQIYVGSFEVDTFTGGNFDDVFFSGDGADTLASGLVVFNCKHHRKHYKKHSTLGNKYAGYSHI